MNSRLPGVSEVYVEGAGDQALAALGRSRSLADVSLAGDFTDAGVREFRGLRLKSLELYSDHLTRACLVDLRSFTRLEVLRLEGASFSDEDVRELKQWLPDCEVYPGRTLIER